MDTNQQRGWFFFTLVLEGIEDISPLLLHSLSAAGFGDCSLSIHRGNAYLHVEREADSQAEAIECAVQNIWAARTDATGVRVEKHARPYGLPELKSREFSTLHPTVTTAD